ncbi:MAG: NAD(P)/FAD-dependent oxidoreductase [Candidatus Bathyarchaeia archaeon]
MAKTILILGGGVGGVVAANTLRKKLGRQHEIVVVDKKRNFEFAPSYIWVMMDWRNPARVVRSLTRLESNGAKYIQGVVSHVNPANRVVEINGEEHAYDYLIISLGADLASEAIPGLAEVAHHFYQLDATEKLRRVLASFSRGTLAIGVASTPFKCPAAPYEAALLIDYHFRRIGIRDRVNMKFFTPEPQPMPVAGPEIGGMISNMLSQRNIEYNPNLKLVSVNNANKELIFDKGEKMKFDLPIIVPPHKPPPAVKESNLDDGSGWIPVHRGTMRTKYDDVYAVGDIATMKLPSGMMLPKAGVFAERQALAVAHNIASDILGDGQVEEWDGKGSCFLEMGYGKAGYASGNFFAEPKPDVKPRRPGRIWHWSKVLFEKYWLWRWL